MTPGRDTPGGSGKAQTRRDLLRDLARGLPTRPRNLFLRRDEGIREELLGPPAPAALATPTSRLRATPTALCADEASPSPASLLPCPRSQALTQVCAPLLHSPWAAPRAPLIAYRNPILLFRALLGKPS